VQHRPRSRHPDAKCSALDDSNPDGAADEQRAGERLAGADEELPVAVQPEGVGDARPVGERQADG
jgi:hypothetical protein